MLYLRSWHRLVAIILSIALTTLSLQGVAAEANTADAQQASSPGAVTVNYEGPMGLSVNTFTDSLYYNRLDVGIPSENMPIDLGMAYSSSLAGVDLGYGFGWQFSYNDFYYTDKNGAVVELGDGNAVIFTRSGTDFVPPPGVQDTFKEYTPGKFVLTQQDGVNLYFDVPGHKHVTRIADLNGNQIAFAYNGTQLSGMVDTWGHAIILAYKNNHPASLTVNAGGTRTVQYEYDTNGDLTKVTDSTGKVTSYSYDKHLMKSLTDPRRNTANVAYQGQLVTSIKSPLTDVSFVLNSATRTTTVINNLNGKTPEGIYVYDSLGRISQVLNAVGSSIRAEWDSHSNLTRLTDENGGVMKFTYDNRDNMLTRTDALGNVQTLTYDNQDNVTSSRAPSGRMTTFKYDDKRNLLAETDGQGHTVAYSYDAHGYRTKEVDENGNATSYQYDNFGYQNQLTDPLGKVTSLTHNGFGNLLKNLDPAKGAVNNTYDAAGQLLTSDASGKVTTLNYDEGGNLIAVSGPNGNHLAYTLDALDRVATVTDAAGNKTSYTYDTNNNLAAITDADGNTTTFTYDAARRLTKKTDPLGKIFNYVYDKANNLISQTDANGDTVKYEYDAGDRLTAINYPDPADKVTYKYDANGNRLEMTDSTGKTSYVYDSLDHVTSVTDPHGNKIAYSYDPTGQLTEIGYPDGSKVDYTYDAGGNLIKVGDKASVTSYAYDDAGTRIKRTLPNNVTTTYTYDAYKRLTGLTHNDPSGKVLYDFKYTLDASGMRTAAQKTDPSGQQQTTQYTYDSLDQLTKVTYSDKRFEQYSYDHVGNRLSKTTEQGTTTYTYNSYNQLTASTGTDGQQTTYEYDNNGNLTKRHAPGADTTYTYEYGSRLMKVAAKNTVEFQYNGDGDRTAKIVDGARTDYVVDSVQGQSEVIAEQDSSGGKKLYTLGATRLAQSDPANPDATTFSLEDGLGSVIASTDMHGQVTQSFAYDSFGNPGSDQTPAPKSSPSAPWRYTNEQTDPETGLLYLRARYYDPTMGRFLTRDPFDGLLNVPQTLHGYGYVGNNPANLTDPSGQLFFLPFLISYQTRVFALKTFGSGSTFLSGFSISDQPCLVSLLVDVIVTAVVNVAVAAVVGGITAAVNHQNFWEGVKNGALDAVKDPTTYIPGGFGKVARYGIEAYRVARIAGKTIAESAFATVKQAAKKSAAAALKSNLKKVGKMLFQKGKDKLDPKSTTRGQSQQTVKQGGLDGVQYLYDAVSNSKGGVGQVVSAQSLYGSGQLTGNVTLQTISTAQGSPANVSNNGQNGGQGNPSNPSNTGPSLADQPGHGTNGLGTGGGEPAGGCIGAPKANIFVNIDVIVVQNNGAPLGLRLLPSNTAGRLAWLDPGTIAHVVQGPVCGSSDSPYAWYKIQTPQGLSGWVPEGDSFRTDAHYFVLPPASSSTKPAQALNCASAPPSLVHMGDTAVVNSAIAPTIQMRKDPGGDVVKTLDKTTPLAVIQGPQCGPVNKLHKWWQVQTADNTTGWVEEGNSTELTDQYYILPAVFQGVDKTRTVLDAGCAASPLTLFQIGDVTQVATGDGKPLSFRETPEGKEIDQLKDGTRLEIVGGPRCSGAVDHWQVRTAGGTLGWVSDGDTTQASPYSLKFALPDPKLDKLGFKLLTGGCAASLKPHLQVGTLAYVTAALQAELPLLSSPLSVGQSVENLEPGDAMIVMDNPVCGDQGVGTWWLVRAPDGGMGWVRESDSSNYLIAPLNSQ